MKNGLSKGQHGTLIDIFKKILSPADQVKVFIFGSRATKQFRPDSDLDLLLHGKSEVPLVTIARLKEAFEESDLPFTVDIVDYYRMSADSRDIITRKILID